MADETSAHPKRGSIKSSVGSVAVQRRREQAVMVGKERREALMRTKRLCRVGVHMDDNADAPADDDMMADEEQSVLEGQTFSFFDRLDSTNGSFYLTHTLTHKFITFLQDLKFLAFSFHNTHTFNYMLLFSTGIISLHSPFISYFSGISGDDSCMQVLRSLGNLVAGDSYVTSNVLVAGHDITVNLIQALIKCLKSEHRVLKKESAWVLSNVAAGSVEHKKLIHSSEAVSSLIRLLSTEPFDIKKEVTYVLGNLCVAPSEGSQQPSLIVEHLVSLVGRGGLGGFIDLVSSADVEAARLGLQFLELVLRGMPNGEGPKLVEAEDGIDAMERFQFHENEDLRNMANELVDKYFGEDYGLDS